MILTFLYVIFVLFATYVIKHYFLLFLLTVLIRAFSFYFICLIKVEKLKYFVVVHWQKSAADLLEEETRQLKLNGISCSKQTTNVRTLDIIRVTGKVSCKHILYHKQLLIYILMHMGSQ